MRLHRFYIQETIEDKEIKIINDDLIHQLKNVFRYLVGGQVIVFNGDGYDYLCMITELHNHSGVLSVISRRKSIMPEKNIGIAFSLIKKDNMELVIQKATELGVSKIFPIVTERSEKKALNMIRAQKIATEASEQSGRGNVPQIIPIQGLSDFFENPFLNEFEKKIIFTPKEERFNLVASQENSVLLAIGPEGGFSEQEIQMFSQNNFKKYSLGDLVFRAETAAIVGVALFSLS